MAKIKQNKTFLLMLAAMTILLSLTGCQSNAPQEPKPPTYTPTPVEPNTGVETPPVPPAPSETKIESLETFFPYKVGNKWEYEGEGNEYASFTQEVLYQEGNRFQLATDSGGTVMANIFEVSKESIVNVYRSGEEYDGKNLMKQKENLDITLLKLPIAVGTKWVSEENTYEIIQTDAKITVPYGTFDQCIVVRLTFKEGSESILYYKQGIGLLQSEFSSGADKIYSRLKSFTQK